MLVLLEQKGRLNKIILKTDVKPLLVFNLFFFVCVACLLNDVSRQWSQIECVLCKPNTLVGNLAMITNMLLAQVNPHALWYSEFVKPTLHRGSRE